MPGRNESAAANASPSGFPNIQGTEPELEQKIRLLFDKSVSNVHSYSSQIQHDYFDPAYKRAQSFSQVYPVLSVFIGIFSVLSVVPALLFLSASLFILSTSLTVALTLAIVFAASVISFLALLLIIALFWISIVSVTATVFVLSAYQVIHFVQDVREEPTVGAGVKRWASELQESARVRLPTHINAGYIGIGERSKEVDTKVEAEAKDASF